MAAPITLPDRRVIGLPYPRLLSELVRDSRRQKRAYGRKVRALIAVCRWIGAAPFCVDHPLGFEAAAVTGEWSSLAQLPCQFLHPISRSVKINYVAYGARQLTR